MMDRRNYDLLDGIRAVAAFFVMLYHAASVFAPSGFLMVHLFFLISGFVVGHAYDKRLRDGLSVASFLKARMIRLYPLFAISVIFSTILALFHAGALTDDLGLLVLRTLLFLPTPDANANAHRFLFPLNYAYWSLMLEVGATVVYGIASKRLTTPVLTTIAASGMLLSMVFALDEGSLSGGSTEASIYCGVAAITFEFSGGLLLYRLHAAGVFRRIRIWPALVLLAPAVIASAPQTLALQFVQVFFILPALVVVAAEAVVPAKIRPITKLLGDISYPLYAIHLPIIWVLSASGVSVGVALLILLPLNIGLAYLVSRYFDVPVRRALTGRFAGSRLTAAAA